ncbi:hypothetical protein HH213_17135 [Duganella dendranthematis]|uniref:Apea-like HEPN domain-containing protein n=1 Tax=Duganella dendranthematis TaxID=2728021 RepID=A0ABX6MBE8_9BURK|nr:HEPN domain-containing protein [Duganella dendranthematis]QJD91658.1 hypothetical protein HH213_17135 [Duganella dendranthematis]
MEVQGRLTASLLDHPTAYLIRVKVSAREDSKALEIADGLFEQFERIIRFITAQPKTSLDVGILNYSGLSRNSAFVFTDEWSAASTQRKGATQPLPIDNDYLIKHQNGFDTIWSMLGSASPSEMGKRVLLAIDWIGESYAENVQSSAFIKAAIALEILFNEQSDFLTKGIAAQISESVALLLGQGVDEKMAIEKDVRRLYGIRSGIAHAGKSDISSGDLTLLQKLARQSVIRMITKVPFKDAHKASEITTLFKKLKYGWVLPQ